MAFDTKFERKNMHLHIQIISPQKPHLLLMEGSEHYKKKLLTQEHCLLKGCYFLPVICLMHWLALIAKNLTAAIIIVP